ncbi:hypothetical protein ASD23_17270 [Agromyces sp. Root1464]|nr:hypothetical protein ASD23_17270 [Agromyces sp. Root1464]
MHSEPDSRGNAWSDAAPDGVQDAPIMDQNDASTRAKWEGIIAQTRADLGRHSIDDIRQALAQRLSDAQLTVPAGELDRVAAELAASVDGGDRFDRGETHPDE